VGIKWKRTNTLLPLHTQQNREDAGLAKECLPGDLQHVVAAADLDVLQSTDSRPNV